MLTISRLTWLASLSVCLVFQSCYSLAPLNSVNCPAQSNPSLAESHSSRVRNDIPIRSMRQLLKWFPEATEISWENASTGLHANFEDGNASTSLDFDEVGDCARAFTRYKNFPAEVNKMIAHKYTGYAITSVYSVTSYGEHIRIDYNIVITQAGVSKVLTWNNTDFRLQEISSTN